MFDHGLHGGSRAIPLFDVDHDDVFLEMSASSTARLDLEDETGIDELAEFEGENDVQPDSGSGSGADPVHEVCSLAGPWVADVSVSAVASWAGSPFLWHQRSFG